MHLTRATVAVALALVCPTRQTVRASFIVEFSYPASVTEIVFGVSIPQGLPPTDITGLIFGLATSSTSNATSIELTSGQPIDFDINGFILKSSFTLDDGVVSAASYAVESPFPQMGSFALDLQEGELTTYDLSSWPSGFSTNYVSSAAPVFAIEQIAEPRSTSLLTLALLMLAWCRGRRTLATVF